MLQQQRSGFYRRKRLGARLVAQFAKARSMPRVQDETTKFEEPRIAPPQGLGLAPAAVEQHDAFEAVQHRILVSCRRSSSVERDNLSLGTVRSGADRAQIEYRPAFCIDCTAKRARQVR